MGMGFIFSSDTLEFLIIGTGNGILRKIWLGNGIKTSLQGPLITIKQFFVARIVREIVEM